MSFRRLARAVPYAVALVGLLLVALAAVTTASADAAQRTSRLVPIGSSQTLPSSDGRHVLWATAAGQVEVRDPITGARHTLTPEPGCVFFRARPPGFALITCGSYTGNEATRLIVVGTVDGRTVFDGTAAGRVDDWGDQWIDSFHTAGCYHCDSVWYTNWHTGEQRSVDGMEQVPVDLDAPDLRLRPPHRPDRPRARLVRTHSTVVLVQGRRHRTLGRCQAGCSSLALRRGRASWIDHSGKADVRSRLVETDLRSGRRWQWSLRPSTASYMTGDIEHRTLRVGSAIVLISWSRWRAGPYRFRLAVR